MKKIYLSIFTVFLSLMLCIPLFSTLSYAETSEVQKAVTTLVKTPLYQDATKKVRYYPDIPSGTTVNATAYQRVGYDWWCKVTYNKKTGWIELRNVSNLPFLTSDYKYATFKVTHSKGANVRESHSTGAKIVTSIPKNTTVKFSTFKTIGKCVWGKISYSSSKNGTCKNKWVCIKENNQIYINFVGNFKTTDSIVIRKTSYKDGKIVAASNKGNTFNIYRIELNKKGNWWGKIRSSNSTINNCWIYLGNLKPN